MHRGFLFIHSMITNAIDSSVCTERQYRTTKTPVKAHQNIVNFLPLKFAITLPMVACIV